MKGRGAGDWIRSKWNAAKDKLKSFGKNVAKDTILPIGRDLLLGRKPTAGSIAQSLKNSVKSNVMKEISPYVPVSKKRKGRRTVRRRF